MSARAILLVAYVLMAVAFGHEALDIGVATIQAHGATLAAASAR